ncbi:S8 family serine peptidase [Isoptericola cucumis]|uniref:Peptidase n=1 Tax=Isoptericola cucumis TaxID=1776856 RepID=A0ABQ2BDQ6_9MICO|nr:S8 family serine peptidase [Isoptericola cucumis]GGI11966.1 peptidase [Isoptericola cucumis]
MRRTLLAGITTTAVVVASFGGAATADPGGGGATPATERPGAAATSVTLLTGDTVRLHEADGRRAVTIEPGEGRETIDVHQLEIDGELYVLPLDVLPYVAEDLLDRELFSVDALVSQGYDDASTDTLPVIATLADGARPGVRSLAAAEPQERLESIDAQALAVDKEDAGRFWESVAAGDVGARALRPGAEDAALAGGVEKLWLDGQVQVDLDESTAQIGAPTAWDAGVDGTGTTVAVLDTGVDVAHPDLAGKVVAEENFSTSATPADGHGHGTHVASTVAGTGAGSDGRRSGVAPGADLLSGKVLSDAGTGYDSDIIAGMEWAAGAGADVVNLSLGGGPTDGSDPLSSAVDALSADHDVLFVVSAGNDGPRGWTVGTPGAAASALTVGAVDRADVLADFSSRGPRLGDLAVKPDLTAPGVGIVAARAAGTGLGDPVDDLYTAANGTSMAAPHVAGAAALLAAQHPGWSRAQLKDALVSTAATGAGTPYEQGGGRVDVARAATQQVTGTGTVHLGSFTDGDDGRASSEVTWTNEGDADVELSLSLTLADAQGDPTGDAVDVGGDTVTVPAGGSAGVPVTADVGALPVGQHTGWLTATAGDVVVHTTVGVVKEPPIHTVTVRGLDRSGEEAMASPVVLLGEDPRFDVVTFDKPGETRRVRVGEGAYFLHAMVNDGQGESSVIVDPDLEITGDTELVVDARDANPVRVVTPKPAEPRGNLGFTTYRDIGSRRLSNSTMKFDGTSRINVTPTEPADGGYFEFTSRWQLAAPMLRAREPGRHGLVLWPRYERYSPEADLRGARPVVDVGRGLAEDYAGRDVAGAVVVVHLDSKGQERAAAAAAAEAGAAAVLVAPAEGTSWWVKFTGRGARLPLPVAVLAPDEVDRLARRLAQGPTELRLSGDQQYPYRYDVVQVSPDRVPRDVVHRVSPANTATVEAGYHEMGGEEWSKEQRFAWRPWQRSTIVESQHELRTPQSRVEYVSAGDTLWRQHVLHYFSWDSLNPISGGATHDLRTYAPGERVAYDWYGGVQRPAVREASRSGDELTIQVPEFVQGAAETSARASASEASGRVLEDGVVIGEGPGVWGTFRARKPAATYQVELATRRDGADWELGTATRSVWTFGSRRPAGSRAAGLPMMRVDHDVPVGLDNRVHTRRPFHDLRLRVAHPGLLGARAPRVAKVEARVSFDDGATWERLDVTRAGGRAFDARVVHGRRTGPVSLDVRVTDADGGTLRQTVERAYGIG